jgi:hypothetical protein
MLNIVTVSRKSKLYLIDKDFYFFILLYESHDVILIVKLLKITDQKLLVKIDVMQSKPDSFFD